MRKKGPVNPPDLFLFFYLDYLERDEWIEILWKSHYVQNKQANTPLSPVYIAETIKIDVKEYQFKTTVAPFEWFHTQVLLYFDFYQSSAIVQEIHFFVAICSTLFDMLQFNQMFVQLSSNEPGYLVSMCQYNDASIKISHVTVNSVGTLKAYWTAAPHLTQQEGSRYTVCNYFGGHKDIKECFSKQQKHKQFFIYYHVKSKHFKIWDYSKISWNEASDHCQSEGGFLPIVRSREEQDDLLSIFNKHTLLGTPKIGIYLGLRIHKVCVCWYDVLTVNSFMNKEVY